MKTRMTNVEQEMNMHSVTGVLGALGMVVFAMGVGSTSTMVAATDDARLIRAEIMTQQNAWNAGDIDRFMESYWRSETLTFSSGGKTIRGWQATLERYRKRYPNKSAMGELTFRELEVTMLGDDAAFVLGRWHLKRDKPIGGNFSLVWRRIDGQWRIVHDHSSAVTE